MAIIMRPGQCRGKMSGHFRSAGSHGIIGGKKRIDMTMMEKKGKKMGRQRQS